MMADNVPAVQALGQCIFLPMLIIGGVAVPLASLPDWAQRLSAFFPGRYAVEAMQACVTGNGLGAARFSVLALLLIGAAGCLAAREDVPVGRAAAVRRDARQGLGRRRAGGVGRRRSLRGVRRTTRARVNAWLDERVDHGGRRRPPQRPQQPARAGSGTRTPPTAPSGHPFPSLAAHSRDLGTRSGDRTRHTQPAPARSAARRSLPPAPLPPVAAPPESTPAAPAPAPAPSTPRTGTKLASWRDVTMADIDRDLIFTRLPPDEGVVTPIARLDEEPDEHIAGAARQDAGRAAGVGPGKVADPVQRVRNLLYVAAVPTSSR